MLECEIEDELDDMMMEPDAYEEGLNSKAWLANPYMHDIYPRCALLWSQGHGMMMSYRPGFEI